MSISVPSISLVKSTLNKGLISENKNTRENKLSSDIGEFIDVLAVAYGLKPLAGIDFSAYGRSKFKKLNKTKINTIIEFCNSQGVKSVHNFKKGGMYLKTIFYIPENEQRAINLMAILWLDVKLSSNAKLNNMYMHFYIGSSFGYLEKNIQFFLEKNDGNKLSNKQLDFIKGKISSDKYTLEELNTHHKIQIKTTTKLL